MERRIRNSAKALIFKDGCMAAIKIDDHGDFSGSRLVVIKGLEVQGSKQIAVEWQQIVSVMII